MQNLSLCNEKKNGLLSKFDLHCNMCNGTFSINTDNGNVNTDVVEGVMSAGIGFFNSEELFSAINIPFLSTNLYTREEIKIANAWKKTASRLMREAANEEADYARSIGSVASDGTPLITVVADGCWSKRSYRTNYSALSGAAAIVGNKFGKILYLSVKNKYCSICAISDKEHICYKNYAGSSTGMESQSLVEGFKNSEAMYGIRYSTLIADGDSSTYKRILESRPYHNLTVEKIECRNHLLRNYCNKLLALSKDTRFPIVLRKLLASNIMRLRTAVVSAIKYRKEEDSIDAVKFLKKDIDNSIYHVFGQHTNCERYFCKKSTESLDINYIPDFNNCLPMFNRINQIISSISNHSRSLIRDVDSNIVEQFNSIVCKFVGGKRVNYSKRHSYEGRCYAAVASFNSSRGHSELRKDLYGKSPPVLLKRLEERRRKRTAMLRESRKLKRRSKVKHVHLDENIEYGENVVKPDLDEDVFVIEKDKFMQSLRRSEQEIILLERATVLQADSGFWLEERRKLLTASNFFSVCTRKDSTSCANLVKKFLYSAQNLNISSLQHGKKFEKVAIAQLQLQENCSIEPNGLFIDKQHQFFGNF